MAVYELIAEGTPNEVVTRRVRLYEDGLRLYQSQQWPQAESAFQELLKEFPDDAPSKAMLARIAYYHDHPPAKDWNGVFVAKDK